MNNYGEAFDLSTGEEMKKKKNIKLFITLTILAVIILLGIITLMIWGISYKETHEIKPLEADEGEIIATGNYYQDVIGKLSYFQYDYVKNRTVILEISNSEMSPEDDYIRNMDIIIYEDGTFYERTSDYYDGHNSDSFVLGTIDLTEINDYLYTNQEIFQSFYTIPEIEREEEAAEWKSFVVHYGDKISRVDDERYQKALIGLYLNADMEIIQDYTVSDEP